MNYVVYGLYYCLHHFPIISLRYNNPWYINKTRNGYNNSRFGYVCLLIAAELCSIKQTTK